MHIFGQKCLSPQSWLSSYAYGFYACDNYHMHKPDTVQLACMIMAYNVSTITLTVLYTHTESNNRTVNEAINRFLHETLQLLAWLPADARFWIDDTKRLVWKFLKSTSAIFPILRAYSAIIGRCTPRCLWSIGAWRSCLKRHRAVLSK